MKQQPNSLPTADTYDFQSGSAAAGRTLPRPPTVEQRAPGFLPEGTGGLELEVPLRLAFPSTRVSHIPFAFWLVDAIRPRALVALGVRAGNSYCAFLQAVHSLDLPTRCFGVDHWLGDSQAEFSGEEVYRELSSYHDPRYGEFSTLIRSSFNDALSYFANESIDLLEIGGSHTYEAVAHDFDAWLPKMSPRGVILFHDISVRERDFGVWRVWQDLSARFPTFEFLHSRGLGIAYVGSETPPERLRLLLDAKADAPVGREARAYFARLGAAIADKCELAEVSARARALEAQLGTRTAEAEAARRRLTDLESEFALATRRMTELRTKADEADVAKDRIEELTSAAAMARSQLQQLQSESSLAKRSRAVLLHRHAMILTQQRQMQHQIDIIRGCLSWRITAPLRAASVKYPRLARRAKGALRLLARLRPRGPRAA